MGTTIPSLSIYPSFQIISRQPKHGRSSNFGYMHPPHPMRPINDNLGSALQPGEGEGLAPWAGLGPSLNYFLNSLAHDSEGLKDVGYLYSQGSGDETGGRSIETHLHAAQGIVAPDFLFEVNAPRNYSPSVLWDVNFTPRYALPIAARYSAAVNDFDRTRHLGGHSNSISFQGGRDTTVVPSRKADDTGMQGIRSSAFPNNPSPRARQAGSSTSIKVGTHHVLNETSYQAPINWGDRTGTLDAHQRGNVRHSRGVAAGPARGVKRYTVGSRELVAATKGRRKDKSQPGRFICELCQADLTSKHNLNNHKKSHYGIKDNPCDNCGKAFGTRSSLNRHKTKCKALVAA